MARHPNPAKIEPVVTSEIASDGASIANRQCTDKQVNCLRISLKTNTEKIPNRGQNTH